MQRFEPRDFIRYQSIWPYLLLSIAGLVLAGAILAAFLTDTSAILFILVLFTVFSLFQAFQVIHLRKLSESERQKILEQLASFETKLNRLERELRRDLDQLENKAGQVETELRRDLDQLENKAGQVETEVRRDLDQFEKKVNSKILGLESQRQAAVLRSRSVSPILSADEKEFLLSTAAPALGMRVDRNHLNYRAHRVLNVERGIRGRLAAPVATQVLRNLALISLTGDSVKVLEVGVLFGGAPVCFWDAAFGKFADVNFTLLDLFDGYYGEALDPMTGESISQELVAENLKLNGIGQDHYRIIKGDSSSKEVVSQIDKEIFDFLLIDGDHSYEGLAADFQNYAGLVRQGGLILVDDYQNASWPGVTKYVDEVILKDSRIELLTAGLDTAIFRVI